jgi:Zn-dependent M28 family amino/carboxypeptidase
VLGRDPEPGRGYFYRSDHFPLAKAGVPALSLSEPMDYIGRDPGFAKQVRDSYNSSDYHQPSDEYRAGWDMSGAIEDLRLLAELGWTIANGATVPAYHPAEPFARPRLPAGTK